MARLHALVITILMTAVLFAKFTAGNVHRYKRDTFRILKSEHGSTEKNKHNYDYSHFSYSKRRIREASNDSVDDLLDIYDSLPGIPTPPPSSSSNKPIASTPMPPSTTQSIPTTTRKVNEVHATESMDDLVDIYDSLPGIPKPPPSSSSNKPIASTPKPPSTTQSIPTTTNKVTLLPTPNAIKPIASTSKPSSTTSKTVLKVQTSNESVDDSINSMSDVEPSSAVQIFQEYSNEEVGLLPTKANNLTENIVDKSEDSVTDASISVRTVNANANSYFDSEIISSSNYATVTKRTDITVTPHSSDSSIPVNSNESAAFNEVPSHAGTKITKTIAVLPLRNVFTSSQNAPTFVSFTSRSSPILPEYSPLQAPSYIRPVPRPPYSRNPETEALIQFTHKNAQYRNSFQTGCRPIFWCFC